MINIDNEPTHFQAWKRNMLREDPAPRRSHCDAKSLSSRPCRRRGVSFSGVGITRITQSQWRHPGFKNYVQQYQEHVNWFRGKHSLKAGVIFTRVRFEDNQASANLFGALTFSERFTGQPYADFLLGIPTSAARAFPPVLILAAREPLHRFYAWQAVPNLH